MSFSYLQAEILTPTQYDHQLQLREIPANKQCITVLLPFMYHYMKQNNLSDITVFNSKGVALATQLTSIPQHKKQITLSLNANNLLDLTTLIGAENRFGRVKLTFNFKDNQVPKAIPIRASIVMDSSPYTDEMERQHLIGIIENNNQVFVNNQFIVPDVACYSFCRYETHHVYLSLTTDGKPLPAEFNIANITVDYQLNNEINDATFLSYSLPIKVDETKGEYLFHNPNNLVVQNVNLIIPNNTYFDAEIYSRADTNASWNLKSRAKLYNAIDLQSAEPILNPEVDVSDSTDQEWMIKIPTIQAKALKAPVIVFRHQNKYLLFQTDHYPPFMIAYGSETASSQPEKPNTEMTISATGIFHFPLTDYANIIK